MPRAAKGWAQATSNVRVVSLRLSASASELGRRCKHGRRCRQGQLGLMGQLAVYECGGGLGGGEGGGGEARGGQGRASPGFSRTVGADLRQKESGHSQVRAVNFRCSVEKAWFHGSDRRYHRGGTPSQTISGSGAGNQPSPTPSAVIANNLTRGLALAPVTSHRVSGEPPPLSSGEPLALRAPAWSMKHMPPTSSPIRPDGVLANHTWGSP